MKHPVGSKTGLGEAGFFVMIGVMRTRWWFFLAALAWMALLQAWGRSNAYQGMYFQPWSSEDMMQAVPLSALRIQPLQSLLSIHIQPPLFDVIRTLAVQLHPGGSDAQALRFVDGCIYALWAVAYALMGTLIFHWLAQLLGHQGAAAAAAAIFLLHPAAIFYATFLETTFLTSLGVLWLSYSLWQAGRNGRNMGVTLAYLFLFSIRSIFQWPGLLIVFIAQVLIGLPRRRIAIFLLVAGTITFAYQLKQYLVFGEASTSSFGGSSCLHALGGFPSMDASAAPSPPLGLFLRGMDEADLPLVLTLRTKLTGVYNFNYYKNLSVESGYLHDCVVQLRTQPLSQTLLSYAQNALIFWLPSSRYYTAHVIVDRLPWRGLYDWLFSLAPFVGSTLFASAYWMATHEEQDLPMALAMALPILFIFGFHILFEKFEDFRYKFFIEPILYILIISQAAAFLRKYGLLIWSRSVHKRAL